MKLRFQRKLSNFLDFLDFLESKVSKEAKHQIEDAFVRKARWRIYISNSLRQTRHRAWVEELVDQGTNWLIDGLIDGLID